MAGILLLQFSPPSHGVLISTVLMELMLWIIIRKLIIIRKAYSVSTSCVSSLQHGKVGGPSTYIVCSVSSGWCPWKQVAFSICYSWAFQPWAWVLTMVYLWTQPSLKGIWMSIWKEVQNSWKQIWETCEQAASVPVYLWFSSMSCVYFLCDVFWDFSYPYACTLIWLLGVFLVKFMNWLQWKYPGYLAG